MADRTTQVEHRGALMDALAGLPLRQRSAVVLRYFEDMTPAQIAAALGTRESTVRSQITRGLAGLRDDGVLAALAGRPQESLKGLPR
ncbi:sigma-70 family RNA polymerase sigma factor [Streptomyces sp. NPDC004267]|uniref:sigma-70 family RNA polymerase sigma factor n=1 Tax=Streptomyces sp. NPDC004267 TaxID=3364694 RepID=UPI0036B16360